MSCTNARDQVNTTCSEEKNHLNGPRTTQMLELADKDIKTPIMFQIVQKVKQRHGKYIFLKAPSQISRTENYNV